MNTFTFNFNASTFEEQKITEWKDIKVTIPLTDEQIFKGFGFLTKETQEYDAFTKIKAGTLDSLKLDNNNEILMQKILKSILESKTYTTNIKDQKQKDIWGDALNLQNTTEIKKIIKTFKPTETLDTNIIPFFKETKDMHYNKHKIKLIIGENDFNTENNFNRF